MVRSTTRNALNAFFLLCVALVCAQAASAATFIPSGNIDLTNRYTITNWAQARCTSGAMQAFNANGSLNCTSTGSSSSGSNFSNLQSIDAFIVVSQNGSHANLSFNTTAGDARYALLSAFNSMYTNVTSAQSSITLLQAFQSGVYTNVTSAQSAITALQSADASFTTNVSTLVVRVNTLNSSVIVLNSSVTTLQVRVDTLNTTTTALSSYLASLTANFTGNQSLFNSSISTLQIRTNTLNSSVINLNSSVTTLQVQAATFNTTIGLLAANITGMNATALTAYNVPFACSNAGEYVMDAPYFNSSGSWVFNCTAKGSGIYAGANITIVRNANGSINISAAGGSGSSFDPSGLYANVTGLQSANASMNASILTLQVRVDTLNSTSAKQTYLDSLTANFTGNQSVFNSSIQTLQVRANTFNTTDAAYNTSITNLQIRVDTINSTYALQTALTSLTANFTANQSQDNATISTLQVRANTFNTSIIALQAQTTTLNASVIALQTANTSMNTTLTQLQIGFNSLNSSLGTALINWSMMNITNAGTNGQILSRAANGQFTWVDDATGGGSGGGSGFTMSNCGSNALPFATNSTNLNCTGIYRLFDTFRNKNYTDFSGNLITNSSSFRQPSKTGLVLDFHFDNAQPGTGAQASTLQDSSPKAFDGVLAGSPTYQSTGSHDDSGAYNFLASGDQINIPYTVDQNSYANTREITFGCWVYANWDDQYNGFPRICLSKNAVTNNRVQMYFNNASKAIVLNVGNGSATDDATDSQGYIFQNNTWYFIAASFDACGTNLAKMYINGEIIAARSQTYSNPNCTGLVNDTGDWKIGENFKGKLDDVFLYDRVLTDEEVRNIYESRYKATPTLGRSGHQNIAGELYANQVRVLTMQDYWCPFTVTAATTSCYPNYLGAAAGTGGTVTNVAGTANHPGILQMNAGTANPSGYRYVTTTTTFLINGSERFSIGFAPQSVPAGNKSIIYSGFIDTTAVNTEATDGVYFRTSNLVVGGMVASNSVRQATSTNYTMSAGTWYVGVLNVSENANSATFTIYNDAGTALWQDSISGGAFPIATGRETGAGIVEGRIGPGTTATANVYVDYINAAIPDFRKVT